MRIIPLAALTLAACATAPSSTGEAAPRTRTSTVSVGSLTNDMGSIIHVQAGEVRVRHSVPSNARLRATRLEGLDPANRHLRYEWERDGVYEVEVSGRYSHSVAGSIVGGGAQDLTSTLTYTPLADPGEAAASRQHGRQPES